MTLEELGYDTDLANYRKENGLEALGVGRVIAEHKERYVVKDAEKEYEAEILGNLRYAAQSRADFPAVGDWVAFADYDENKVLIHTVYPRKSVLERQAVGVKADTQIIASNIDTALIVQSVDRDFSINRIERYLTICNTAKVEAIVILNKIDLIDETVLPEMIESVQKRIIGVPALAISNATQQGIEGLKALLQQGKTYCLLGSSGVGKSTLLNTISGQDLMKTSTINEHSNRGRHVTTHRELRVLENGGILIDNPGIREVGIADASGGLEQTFEKILSLANECKFADCSHTTEFGCAVIAAVENGEIDNAALDNYLRLEREKEHYNASLAEKRKKDKDFGKMVKHFKKTRKSNKF